jgi:hypothetical protein
MAIFKKIENLIFLIIIDNKLQNGYWDIKERIEKSRENTCKGSNTSTTNDSKINSK